VGRLVAVKCTVVAVKCTVVGETMVMPPLLSTAQLSVPLGSYKMRGSCCLWEFHHGVQMLDLKSTPFLIYCPSHIPGGFTAVQSRPFLQNLIVFLLFYF
jgi:hypothetical protein